MSNYPSIYTCSRVYTVRRFRTVSRYFRLVLVISVACVYVCTCSKQRDTRQIMASHHGRENCLMKNVRPVETLDNKVKREENRKSKTFPSKFSSTLSVCLHSVSTFLLLAQVVLTTIHEIFDYCSFWRKKIVYDSFLELPRFLAKIRIEGINSPTCTEIRTSLFFRGTYTITSVCNENYRISYLQSIEIGWTMRNNVLRYIYVKLYVSKWRGFFLRFYHRWNSSLFFSFFVFKFSLCLKFLSFLFHNIFFFFCLCI